ncbi:MAG: hypothetical protein GF335_04005 [Candidatus Moranbacteria bacterium]|nr:hypothetical protein [Candidatus Moranbacteria bacterium]
MKLYLKNFGISSSFLLLLVLGFFLFVCSLPFPLKAQEASSVTVNIYNAQILNQTANQLQISFDLTNRKDVQPQFYYGIELMNKNKTKVLENQVYKNDPVSLGENDEITKKITYEAPDFYDGTYNIRVFAGNNSGKIFAYAEAGEIELTATTDDYAKILENTCFLTVDEDQQNQKYKLNQGVDVLESENLKLNCTISNSSSRELNLDIFMDLYLRSILGEKLETKKMEQITIAPKQNQSISIDVIKGEDPQAYTAVLYLKNNGKLASNKVNAHYVIAGDSGAVQNVVLDKKSYQKGEMAVASLSLIGSADQFPQTRHGFSPIVESQIEVRLIDENQRECSDPVKQDITKEIGEGLVSKQIEFLVDRKCNNAQAKVEFMGRGEGEEELKLYDRETYQTAPKPQSKLNNKVFIAFSVVLAIVFLAIIIIYIINERKKSK